MTINYSHDKDDKAVAYTQRKLKRVRLMLYKRSQRYLVSNTVQRQVNCFSMSLIRFNHVYRAGNTCTRDVMCLTESIRENVIASESFLFIKELYVSFALPRK